MTGHLMRHGCRLLGVLAVTTLCACQGPGVFSQASLQLTPGMSHRAHQERLEVVVGLGRQVLAAVADIDRMIVTVRDAANAEHARFLSASAFTSGRAAASFGELAPGPAAIEVRAFAVDGRLIGKEVHQMDLLQGQTNRTEMTFYLDGAAAPSPGPVQGAITIAVQDGETIPGPPPTTIPKFKPPHQLISYYLSSGAPILVDPSGAVWNGTKRVLPDGTLLELGSAVIKASALTSTGQVWVHRGGKLQLLTLEAQVVRELDAPWEVPYDGMAVDGSNNVWIAAGRQVRKIAPNGTVMGTFDVPGPTGAIAVDKVAGTVWVSLATQGQVARLSPMGALLGVTYVNQFGDTLVDLALDSKGNVWVAQRYSNRVAKLRPDGTIFGNYLAVPQASRLAVDRQDNVLVATSDWTHSDQVLKLSPDGHPLAYYELRDVADMAFDATGGLWYLYGGTLFKVTL